MALLEDTPNAKPASHAHDQNDIRALVGALATLTTAVAGRIRTASTPTYAARAVRTTSSLTPASTAWADADVALDLTLTAAAGQWIEYGLSGNWNSEAASGVLSVVTIVSGVPVTCLDTGLAESGTSEGVQAWRGSNNGVSPVGGSILYQLQAGDIENGQVKLRLRVRVLAAVTKTLFATTTKPLLVWARNLG